MTEYRGGCATGGAVFGLFALIALIVSLVFSGGQVLTSINQARVDREREKARQAQLELDKLALTQEHELDELYTRQTILDHNLAIILALAERDPEVVQWLREQGGKDTTPVGFRILGIIGGICGLLLVLFVMADYIREHYRLQ